MQIVQENIRKLTWKVCRTVRYEWFFSLCTNKKQKRYTITTLAPPTSPSNHAPKMPKPIQSLRGEVHISDERLTGTRPPKQRLSNQERNGSNSKKLKLTKLRISCNNIFRHNISQRKQLDQLVIKTILIHFAISCCRSNPRYFELNTTVPSSMSSAPLMYTPRVHRASLIHQSQLSNWTMLQHKQKSSKNTTC